MRSEIEIRRRANAKRPALDDDEPNRAPPEEAASAERDGREAGSISDDSPRCDVGAARIHAGISRVVPSARTTTSVATSRRRGHAQPANAISASPVPHTTGHGDKTAPTKDAATA